MPSQPQRLRAVRRKVTRCGESQRIGRLRFWVRVRQPSVVFRIYDAANRNCWQVTFGIPFTEFISVASIEYRISIAAIIRVHLIFADHARFFQLIAALTVQAPEPGFSTFSSIAHFKTIVFHGFLPFSANDCDYVQSDTRAAARCHIRAPGLTDPPHLRSAGG